MNTTRNTLIAVLLGILTAGTAVAQTCETVVWTVTSSGMIHKADTNGNVLLSIDATTAVAHPHWARAIVSDAQGNVWVALATELRKYSAAGALLATVTGFPDAQFVHLYAAEIDAEDNGVWIVDRELRRAAKFSSRGRFLVEASPAGGFTGVAWNPSALAVDRTTGDAWIGTHSALLRFDAGGNELVRQHDSCNNWGGGMTSVRKDEASGKLWTSSWLQSNFQCDYAHQAIRLAADGTPELAVGAASVSELSGTNISGIALDPRNGDVWISSISANSRLVKVDSNGNFLAKVDSIWGAQAVAVDPTDGSIWTAGIGGYGEKGLRKFTSDGAFVLEVPTWPAVQVDGAYAITVAQEDCGCSVP